MFIRYEDINSVAFKTDLPIQKNPLFFQNDNFFYYTKAYSFRKIFQYIVFKLGIICPQALQSENYTLVNKETEREKIEVMERAVSMGNIMLKEHADILFKSKKQPNAALCQNFFISAKGKDLFIKQILLPLLELVNTNNKNKWVRIEGKKGFWRYLKDNEAISRGGEVSLNLTTGEKMLKL